MLRANLICCLSRHPGIKNETNTSINTKEYSYLFFFDIVRYKIKVSRYTKYIGIGAHVGVVVQFGIQGRDQLRDIRPHTPLPEQCNLIE